MKVNKDNVVGAVFMLLTIGAVAWGVMITIQVHKIAIAHDRLVAVLDPVIQEIQRIKQIAAQQQNQQVRQEPAVSKEEKSLRK